MFTALFEDGDVPGERMFSFNSKLKTTSTNKSCSQKTPTTIRKSTKKEMCQQLIKNKQDYNKDDQKISNINPQGNQIYRR